jgi:hypothetical protein
MPALEGRNENNLIHVEPPKNGHGMIYLKLFQKPMLRGGMLIPGAAVFLVTSTLEIELF